MHRIARYTSFQYFSKTDLHLFQVRVALGLSELQQGQTVFLKNSSSGRGLLRLLNSAAISLVDIMNIAH